MALDPITGAETLIDDALNKFIPDPAQKAQASAAVLQIIETAKTSLEQSQASVINTEIASKSWLAMNWRPLTMMMFVFMIFNNYVLVPYIQMMFHVGVVLELPSDCWSLLKIGIGGYVFCRTGEKMVGAGVHTQVAGAAGTAIGAISNVFKGH